MVDDIGMIKGSEVRKADHPIEVFLIGLVLRESLGRGPSFLGFF